MGIGAAAETSRWIHARDAAAAAARATAKKGSRLAIVTSDMGLDVAALTQALTEGALLARYRYRALQAKPKDHALSQLTIVVTERRPGRRRAGHRRGRTGRARDRRGT